MKLSQRLQMMLKALLDDLFGEEPQPALASDASGDPLTPLVEQAQQWLDTLHLELADAADRHTRLEQAWRQASADTQALDGSVDAALQAGQTEQARDRLEQARRLQADAQELGELYQSSQQLLTQLGAAIQEQQARLEAMRRRSLVLADREHNASTLEDFLRLQRDLSSQASALQAEFTRREQQIARREDLLAARRELTAQ